MINIKNIKQVLLSVAILPLMLSCNDSTDRIQNETNGGKLFIIGGGSRSDAMMQRMIEEADIGDGSYAVILPMSSEIPDSAIIWTSGHLEKLGLENIVGFNFQKNNNEDYASWIDSLKNASLIYITGGDQNRFMSVVKDTDIEKAIHYAWKNGAMIAGTSAGAAVMSRKMITGNELNYPEYRPTFRTIEYENIELGDGLGFLENVIIDQHFVWRSRHNRLLSAIIENPDMIGIGIDESTAILVKGNEYEVVGESQVLLFKNSNGSFYEKDGKLGVRNMIIDIYLEGEKFIID